MTARAIAWVHVLAGLTVAIAATSKIDCNDGQFYIRADPDSCSNFYKCDNGRPVKFPCPGGLYFNPTIYVCDWPYNVKCSINNNNNQGQNIDKHDSSNTYNNQDQYSGYDVQEDQHYGNDQFSNNEYDVNENGQTPYYVVQTVPDEGPSVQEPYGPLQRPRPTVDDDQTANNHPYRDNVEPDIDIR